MGRKAKDAVHVSETPSAPPAPASEVVAERVIEMIQTEEGRTVLQKQIDAELARRETQIALKYLESEVQDIAKKRSTGMRIEAAGTLLRSRGSMESEIARAFLLSVVENEVVSEPAERVRAAGLLLGVGK